MTALRIAVIGVGAFGRNHLRVYRELQTASPGQVQLVAVVDAAIDAGNEAAGNEAAGNEAAGNEAAGNEAAGTEAARTEAAQRYGVAAFASVADLLASGIAIDAASVCVPTVHHAAIAEQLLAAGVDVLIEKPFAASLAEADRVLALAAALGRILQIGHLERFNPAVTAVEPLLNRPMFFEAHRLSVFTPRSLDVDVVLDLMIHDLDIVLQLARSPVRELRAVGLPVLSRKVDIANVRVEFESGCIANFTASRVSTEQVRKLRFFQPRQYLSLDFARQELLTIEVGAAALSALNAGIGVGDRLPMPSEPVSAPHPSAGLSLQKFAVEKSEPLRLELENFLASVRTRSQPRVTGAQGRAALALALDINAAIAEHAHRAGL